VIQENSEPPRPPVQRGYVRCVMGVHPGIAHHYRAGSWFMARAVRIIRDVSPGVEMLVSYSELGRHTGALYRSCNWQPWPTHHAVRYEADGVGYPSGHGSWDGVVVQSPKMRWVYRV
jgi:hypothetical protein